MTADVGSPSGAGGGGITLAAFEPWCGCGTRRRDALPRRFADVAQALGVLNKEQQRAFKDRFGGYSLEQARGA